MSQAKGFDSPQNEFRRVGGRVLDMCLQPTTFFTREQRFIRLTVPLLQNWQQQQSAHLPAMHLPHITLLPTSDHTPPASTT